MWTWSDRQVGLMMGSVRTSPSGKKSIFMEVASTLTWWCMNEVWSTNKKDLVKKYMPMILFLFYSMSFNKAYCRRIRVYRIVLCMFLKQHLKKLGCLIGWSDKIDLDTETYTTERKIQIRGIRGVITSSELCMPAIWQ